MPKEAPMLLPAKRKSPRMGVREVVQKVWPRHRKFVRGHVCCVPGCNVSTIIEFAHARLGTHTGMKQTPHDCFGLSLCSYHHREQHRIGEPEFESRYGIDMKAIARTFTKASPDTAMRESLALHALPTDAGNQ